MSRDVSPSLVVKCIFTPFILLLFPLFLTAQDLPTSINSEPINWSDWEVNIPTDDKLAIVQELKVSVKITFGLEHYNYSISALLTSFHFVDFNKDGYFDIIYNGFAGTNNNGVILYEHRSDGFRNIFTVFGDIIEIWETDPWSKLAFKIHNYRCCDGYVSFIETYNPNLNERVKDHLEYGLSDKIAFVLGTQIPKKFTSFKALITLIDSTGLRVFSKENDSLYNYILKKRPVVNPNPYWRFFKFTGNVTTWFKKGAKGFVLAEKNEGRRRWLFVMMNYDKIEDTVFCGSGHNNASSFSVLGWVRSEDVLILDYFNH